MPDFAFKMKPLPKPEYRLMKSLIDQLSLDSPSELFAVLCRLATEVRRFTPSGTTANLDRAERTFGEVWITQVIDTYRRMPEAERQAEYDSTTPYTKTSPK